MSTPPTNIAIIGCGPPTGKPTLAALGKAVGFPAITVVTRDPATSCAAPFTASGCRVADGDMSDIESMKSAFVGMSAVYIMTPPQEVSHVS